MGFDLQLRSLATGYDMCHGARRDHDIADGPLIACYPGVCKEKTAFTGLKWACMSSRLDGTGRSSPAVAKDEDGMGVPMEEVK